MRRWIALVAGVACSLALAAPAAAHDPTTVGTLVAPVTAQIGPAVTYEGTLQLYHVDDFVDGVGHDAYAIVTPERTVPLDIKGTVPDAWNGARVRIDGNWEGSVVRVPLSTDRTSMTRLSTAPRMAVRATMDADGQGVSLAAGAPLASASKNVAVILFDFSDDTSQPYTPATAAAVAFSNGNAAANFFEEESRGAVTVTGQVFGWYTIAASHATCDPFTWAPLAESAATAAGADLSQFTNIVYAFPHAASCGWAGLGAMPGSQSWNNGAFVLRVVAHELGHNFGVHHASSLDCTSGGLRVSLSTTCTSSEYGDPFSVMGSGTSAHDHATHLGQFGWLPTSEIQTVGPGGPYTVGSVLDGPAGSKRLLRIDRHNGTWFYLDLRSVHGPYFDDFASSAPAVNGVTIRISPDAPSPSYGVSQTQLVDTTPATATYDDAPLAPGQTLVDPVSGLRITTLTAGTGTATVQVVDPIAPGAPIEPQGDGRERDEHRAHLDGRHRQCGCPSLPRAPRRCRRRQPDRPDLQRYRPDPEDGLRLPGHRRRCVGEPGPTGLRRRHDAARRDRRRTAQRPPVAQGEDRLHDDQAVLDRGSRRLRRDRLQGLPGRRDQAGQDRRGHLGLGQEAVGFELLRSCVRCGRQSRPQEPEPEDVGPDRNEPFVPGTG